MSRVFIAEKPSLAEAIANNLGSPRKNRSYFECAGGDMVTWCFGHLLEQMKPDELDERLSDWNLNYLPFVPTDWKKRPKALKDKRTKRDIKDDEGRIKTDPGAMAQLSTIRDLVKQATEVVNAGDPDREGCLLVDEVLEYVGCKKPVKRIWLLGLDDTNVKKALNALEPNSKYRGFTDAAEARGRADYLLGMNFTMGFTVGWKSKGNDGVLHVGRVQTPTLWMVVTRDREIENFKPVDYFLAKFQFEHANGKFEVLWRPQAGTAGLDSEGRLIDRAVAARLVEAIQGQTGTITKLNTRKVREAAPLPFSLSEMQKAANRMFGYSPDKTLKLCQSLYETHKLTTYPRSDCGYIPEAQHAEAPGVLDAVKATMGSALDVRCEIDPARKSGAWDDAKCTAHHGIIPTSKRGSFASLDADEQNIYRLVVRNYLAQFAPDYLYETTSVTVEAGSDREQFTANGKVDKQLGWRTLFESASASADDESGKEKDQKLPAMAEGDHGDMTSGKIDAKKTTPPPRYNGASLVDDMENAHRFIADPEVRKRLKRSKGIGTEATRAGIIANLIPRGYIREEGKGKKMHYISTDKGRALIDSLPDAIKLPDLTAYFEDMLFQIQEGEMRLEDFTSKQSRFASRVIDEIKSGEALATMPSGMTADKKGTLTKTETAEPHDCPDCKAPLKRRQSSKDKRWFWVCDNSHFFDDVSGKPVKREAKEPPKDSGKVCPDCGSKMFVRKGKSGDFFGCSGYPKCRHTEPA